MDSQECIMCPYHTDIETTSEIIEEYFACTHPQWKDDEEKDILVDGMNMMTIAEGTKYIENIHIVPKWCPLRMTQEITPDMPPMF